MSDLPTEDGGLGWYARPTAEPSKREPEGEQPIYFPVPIAKLVVMCLCTLGLYQTYWFFKNFQLEADRAGRGRYVGPFLRAVFSAFLAYSLFTDIKRHSELALGQGRRLAAGWLALAWALLSLSYNLPDPYWLIGMLNFLVLLPVQTVVNDLNTKLSPGADGNEAFSGWELFACGFGLVLTALALMGALVPDPFDTDLVGAIDARSRLDSVARAR
jgi:hypothetical protein